MKKAISLFLIAFLLIFLHGCDLQKDANGVVKVGNESVSEEEFRFYFLLSQMAYENEGGTDIWQTSINGVKVEEVAKERALESMTRVKISCAQAESLGIELTEADKEKATEMVINYRQTLGFDDLEEIGIDYATMLKIMEQTVLYNKVYDHLTQNVQISESDFNDYLSEYIAANGDAGISPEATEQLRESVLETYTSKTKNDVFNEQFKKWEAQMPVEKDSEKWKEIRLIEH